MDNEVHSLVASTVPLSHTRTPHWGTLGKYSTTEPCIYPSLRASSLPLQWLLLLSNISWDVAPTVEHLSSTPEARGPTPAMHTLGMNCAITVLGKWRREHQEFRVGASEVVQPIKGLAIKPEGLSSIPGTHIVEGEN